MVDENPDYHHESTLDEPFSLASGGELLDASTGVVGCVACFACFCGSRWRVNLLSEGRKSCPGCRTHYSHVLIFGPADDPEMVADVIAELEGAGSDADAAVADDDMPEVT